MKTLSSSFRFGQILIFFALALLLSSHQQCCAQAANDGSAMRPPEATQVDFEKFSLHMQQQLQDAKLAIQKEYQETARNQAEAAKTQVAAITDKLNTMQAALDKEQQERADELRRSNLTTLWVAVAFGCVGLIAMLVTAVFQWRTMNQMAEVQMRAQLPASSQQSLLSEPNVSGKVVELSNQRLMNVIDRLERRVFELEHTAVKPLASGDVIPDIASLELEGTARIPALLGKGQALLNADKPEEAAACYDEILKLHTNHPEALVKKGAALERLKKDDEALRCYDRAIAADGTLTIAYLYKGGVFNRQERYNEALECYEQALRVQGGAA